jgi:uncharacterized PurR-regulated membrane protein YhhQ (DUF165 family)
MQHQLLDLSSNQSANRFSICWKRWIENVRSLTDGRYISARLVTSTVCGQTVNTAVFYIFGLWRMIPAHVLTKSIITASLAKVSVQLILLPATRKISPWLKRIENVDHFDRATNFNPLKF